MANHPTNDDIALLTGEFWGRNPHAEMRWMRENAPVYWDASGDVWGLASYRDVRHASLHPELFSNAEGSRPDAMKLPMMVDMDDPEHNARRKLINRGFTPRRISEHTERVGAICDEILDRVCERGSCDFVWDIAAPLPLIVIADALGFAPEHRDDLLEWTETMLRALNSMTDMALLTAATEAAATYREHLLSVAKDRRANPRDDLISVFVHAEVDGDRLDDDELVYETLLLLVGGHETTRNALSGGAYELFTRPDQRDALRTDPAGIPLAVEEILRWVSPIRNMNRTMTRDVELGGQRLRAGERVLLLYPSANRDDEMFAEPDVFDIRRSPNEHLAFGIGTHFCLGASLARLELRLMFERLLARMPDLEPLDAKPQHRPNNFVSGPEFLPVRFTPSAPVALAGAGWERASDA